MNLPSLVATLLSFALVLPAGAHELSAERTTELKSAALRWREYRDKSEAIKDRILERVDEAVRIDVLLIWNHILIIEQKAGLQRRRAEALLTDCRARALVSEESAVEAKARIEEFERLTLLTAFAGIFPDGMLNATELKDLPMAQIVGPGLPLLTLNEFAALKKALPPEIPAQCLVAPG